ncbi:MAG: hypothetical protein NT075_20665, partial [Chloroflexi bacterium]|nr:hypothetical protein [Chloroflexota bacterium]
MKNSLDPRLAFVAGWLLGRRSRHRSGIGCLLLGVGLIFGCSGAMMLVSLPLSWLSAHDISALPQPQPAELAALPAGTRILITAQLPPNLPVDASGLTVFYVERLVADPPSMTNSQATTTAPEWQTIRPPPSRVGMALADRSALLVQIGPATRFLHAQQVALDGKELATSQQRAVGYQAGQV